MSSSSEPAVPLLGAQKAAPKDLTLLAELIGALASEVAVLAREITGIGDALSTRVFTRGEMHGVTEMQAFDALSQLAHGQARLLEAISRQLGTPTSDMKEALAAVIAGLPVLKVRRRMLGVVDPGSISCNDLPRSHGPDDDETWF